ncbi:hypothetical protein [Actinoplanes subglobosus]|uniref:Uncharacterized protein n=1 Tax=Actinoplanes subglobosus TaxID=1547892 RepID=A0ABV8IIF6_9ACTN
MASNLRKKGLAAAAVAGVAASVMVGTPALAISDGCSLTSVGSLTSCQSLYINANYSGHFIDWRVCGGTLGTNWRVRDYTGGVVVGSGIVNTAQCKSGRINGLYSIYRIELYAGTPGASGTIDNV